MIKTARTTFNNGLMEYDLTTPLPHSCAYVFKNLKTSELSAFASDLISIHAENSRSKTLPAITAWRQSALLSMHLARFKKLSSIDFSRLTDHAYISYMPLQFFRLLAKNGYNGRYDGTTVAHISLLSTILRPVETALHSWDVAPESFRNALIFKPFFDIPFSEVDANGFTPFSIIHNDISDAILKISKFSEKYRSHFIRSLYSLAINTLQKSTTLNDISMVSSSLDKLNTASNNSVHAGIVIHGENEIEANQNRILLSTYSSGGLHKNRKSI
jgi:hypothetical protein